MTSGFRHQRPLQAVRKPLWCCAAFLLALRVFAVDGSSATNCEFSGVARISFKGTSTLHDFEGHVSAQPVTLNLLSNSWSAVADVLSGAMTTANESRDRNMWKMLGTNLFPRIRGVVRDAPVPETGTSTGRATMSLSIRDRQRDIPVTLSNWSESEGVLRFEANWLLSLRQYNLSPPSVMGVVRVGDKVQLHAEVLATNVLSPLLTRAR